MVWSDQNATGRESPWAAIQDRPVRSSRGLPTPPGDAVWNDAATGRLGCRSGTCLAWSKPLGGRRPQPSRVCLGVDLTRKLRRGPELPHQCLPTFFSRSSARSTSRRAGLIFILPRRGSTQLWRGPPMVILPSPGTKNSAKAVNQTVMFQPAETSSMQGWTQVQVGWNE